MADLNPYRAPRAAEDERPPSLEQAGKCPKCGANTASKVNFNWWGGALAPRIFHIVKCTECKTQYNGRTGGRLTKVALLYQVIIAVIILAGWWGLRS